MTTTALSYIFALVGAIITGITQNLWFLFMLSPFLVMGLFVAPYKFWKKDHDELERMKEKRLKVSLAPNYEPGDGSHWLRLRVDNPSGEPIPDCYGKVDSYTMLIEVEGSLRRVTDLPVGVSLNNGLPPERHAFPWASTDLPDVTVTIPSKGHDFLYIVVINENSTYFHTPSDMGLKYPKVKVHAEYEVVIDIGSGAEAFLPTKVRLHYAMTGRKIEAKGLEVVNEPNPDKEGSRT